MLQLEDELLEKGGYCSTAGTVAPIHNSPHKSASNPPITLSSHRNS
jgi:hypothetical protein